MHEHDNQRDLWPPLTGAFFECKTQSNVAIMRDLTIVLRGFREITKRSHCSGSEKEGGEINQWEKQNNLPAEKQSNILLHFYDTYTYYYIPKNLLALCSGCPAPLVKHKCSYIYDL